MNHANARLAKAKIIERIGYFPAFLIPALESPLILRDLVRQTFIAYRNNPLPSLLKEKLFVYLSRYCGADYFTICHSCNLQSLGTEAAAILSLQEIEYPQTGADIESDIGLLESLSQNRLESWQNQDKVEASLLKCSAFIFLYPDQADQCAVVLKQVLGVLQYNYLIILLGYIKACHQWLQDNPHIDHSQDQRSQLHLGTLLLSQAKLVDFLQPQGDRFQVSQNNSVNQITPTVGSQVNSKANLKANPKALESQVVVGNNYDNSYAGDRPADGDLPSRDLANKTSAENIVSLEDNMETALKTESSVVEASLDDANICEPEASEQEQDNLELKSETFAAFTSYLENLPFPVMINHESGKIMYLNRNWLDTTGFSASEMATIKQWQETAQVKARQRKIIRFSDQAAKTINLSPMERYASQIKEIALETQNTLQQIVESLVELVAELAQVENQHQAGNTTEKEIDITTSSGEKRCWQMHSATLNYGVQEQLTISMVKDISDVHQAHSQLELVLEATYTGTWNWDLSNNQINVCDRGRAILGLEKFDGSYASFLSTVYAEERESVDLFLIRTVKAYGEIDLEYRVVRPDQKIRRVRTRGRIDFNAEGQETRIEGIVTDVTSQRRAANSGSLDLNHLINLPRQNQQTKGTQVLQSLASSITLLDLLPYYIFVVALPSKTIPLMNSSLINVLGLSDLELKEEKTLAECFPLEYSRQIIWQQQQVLTYGEVLRLQEEVTLADGSHHFYTVITPLKNIEGEIEATLHTSSDIPNLIATQEALSQRSLQLEAANRELESFSYSVSHDLQAPLRIINGFSQVLWENCQANLDDRAKHYLERIQANSQKMSDLIDALLELSRVTRSEMKSVVVNLSEMAADIVAELRAEYPQRQVEVKIAPDLYLQGDSQLWRIVLCNLFNNAWKYTSKRSLAKIEFNLLQVNPRQKPVYFIRDNGAGFAQEYADKLFKAFQRLHTQEEFLGTGIGLATVQRIIYRHGGKVWAEGDCDHGATIYFSL